jgi:hypothetical protein
LWRSSTGIHRCPHLVSSRPYVASRLSSRSRPHATQNIVAGRLRHHKYCASVGGPVHCPGLESPLGSRPLSQTPGKFGRLLAGPRRSLERGPGWKIPGERAEPAALRSKSARRPAPEPRWRRRSARGRGARPRSRRRQPRGRLWPAASSGYVARRSVEGGHRSGRPAGRRVRRRSCGTTGRARWAARPSDQRRSGEKPPPGGGRRGPPNGSRGPGSPSARGPPRGSAPSPGWLPPER